MNFSRALLNWYQENKRDLPWRGTKDPYPVWLSEIIMQQTRVEQGTAYYHAFLKAYPSVKHLAKAPEDEVLKLWQGLGYYSRARNMHLTAQVIYKEYKGKFPASYKDIRGLKGVGDYTAAAIASIAFDLPYAVVDGNVYRVLSRVFGISTPIDSTSGKKEFQELAQELLDKKQPGNFNQALMEFGAQFCKPRNPDCPDCIFSGSCLAYARNKVNELPVKANKTKVRDRYFNYLVIRHKESTFVRKRTGKDIWNGLYDFPLIESRKIQKEKDLTRNAGWNEIFGTTKPVISRESTVYKHILSHQRIFAKFWEIEVKAKPRQKEWIETKISRLGDFAVPRLVDIYLNKQS